MAISAERNQSYWQRLELALSNSPSLAATVLAVSFLGATLYGPYLTPAAHTPVAPFMFPVLLTTFIHRRWIWTTTTAAIAVYVTVALIDGVPGSYVTTNAVAVIVFGLVCSWLTGQRQKLDERSRALLSLEENIRFAIDKSDLRVFSHDRDLRYTWVPSLNPSFAREQMLGATDAELFPPDEARGIMAIKRRALEEEMEVHDQVTVMRDGESRTFDLTVVPTYTTWAGDRRELTGISCVSIDVTEFERIISEREDLARRQELALEEAARARENLEHFTSMVAHDLGQPLTAAQGFAGILRQRLGASATEQQLRALEMLARAIVQMKRLTDDLVDVAALEQGRFSVDIQVHDLVDVVHEVVSDYQTTTESHTIHWVAPEHLWGYCDAARIHQLVGNLLSNAVKYSPGGGTINVLMSVTNGRCVLEVIDLGVGMSSDQLTLLFEMFARLENVSAIRGLGLGLFICKGIAEAHGGRITVESTPGQGSTFRVELPLSPRIAAERHAPSAQTRSTRSAV